MVNSERTRLDHRPWRGIDPDKFCDTFFELVRVHVMDDSDDSI